MKACFFVVVDAAKLPLHKLHKYKIDTVQYLLSASEIAEHIYPFVFRSAFKGECVVFFRENVRIGKPESVYALFHVADHKTVRSVGNKIQHRFLHGVGILILISHNINIFLREFLRRLRFYRMSHIAALLGKRRKTVVLQISVISYSSLPFFRGEPVSKLPHKIKERENRFLCLGYVFFHFLRVSYKKFLSYGRKYLFCLVTQSFDLFLCRRVTFFP